MAHKHILVMYLDAADRWWFFCEVCTGRLEVVPIIERVGLAGTRVTASVRVRAVGVGGFSFDELLTVGRLWLHAFNAFVVQQTARPTGRGRRRPARAA
jgi:hypothetical protein